MPRIKSDQERGPIGAWMRRERIARDWSQKEMPDRLATVGQRVDADYYRQLEAGKKPGPEVMDALRRLFNSEPEALPEPAATGDMAALIARLDRQAEVMEELARAVALVAQGQGALVKGLTDAISALSRTPAVGPTAPSRGRGQA